MSTTKMLEKINDALEDAIKPIIAKGASMNANELDVLTKSICAIEKIKQIENADYGYSYERGRSAVTGRYISRDAMPHFEGGTSRRFYDGDIHGNGYSGHSIKDRMIAQLEKMYDEAQTDHERKIVNDWIRRIDTGN